MDFNGSIGSLWKTIDFKASNCLKEKMPLRDDWDDHMSSSNKKIKTGQTMQEIASTLLGTKDHNCDLRILQVKDGLRV